MYKIRLLQGLLLSLLSTTSAYAASPALAPVPQPTPTAAVEVPAPTPTPAEQTQPSLFDDPSQIQTANLTVRTSLPVDSRAVDVWSIHPYPMKPPVIKGPPNKLAETEKDLKYLLLTTGYTSRANPDKPYPVGGWRWQYAYAEAVRRSHQGVPHTMVGAYRWVRDILPYVQRETHAWNVFEEQRFHRYEKTVEEYEKTRVEVENDAVRLGLAPMSLRVRQGQAKAKIPAGNWWLVATRKKPGLTYYWQLPFTAGSGENVNLTLTQPNALIVQGAW